MLSCHEHAGCLIVSSRCCSAWRPAPASANQTALYTRSTPGRSGRPPACCDFGYLGSIASSAIIAITFRTSVSDHGLHVTGIIMVAVSALALVLITADRHLMSMARARPR